MPDLLDTNVVSELPKRQPDSNVLAYFANTQMDSIYLSTVTIAEIRYGIVTTTEEERKHQLERWLHEDVRRVFRGRVLPVTESLLLRWRILMQQGRQSGRTYSQPDLLIAATALEHNLTLVTRNVKDFADVPNLRLINPWERRA